MDFCLRFYQSTKFQKTDCKQHGKSDSKIEICFLKGRKLCRGEDCGKSKKISVITFYPFLQSFQ